MEFSTAKLQCYLQAHKTTSGVAVAGVGMKQTGTAMGMGQAGLMGMGTGIAGAGMNMGMGLDPAVAALFPGGLGVHRGLAQPKEHGESEGEGSPDNASGSEFSAYVDVPVVVAE
ncbi:hypothetical protein C8J57DRAFT_1239979 [Mycena rebaudengoi]|nr:hypothetical protein C8J57DRAFT_1239979 [Mycena rebaudengoi]